MRNVITASGIAAILIISGAEAFAQAKPQQPPAAQPPAAQAPTPAAVKPYKPIAITLPQPLKDQGFSAIRKQMFEAAKKKDRAALAKLTADKFFWDQADGKPPTTNKKGVDVLTEVLELNATDNSGWEALEAYADVPTASAVPNQQNLFCSPADPTFDEKEFQALLKSTGTQPFEWAFAIASGAEVREKPDPKASVTEKLGVQLVRVLEEEKPQSEEFVRVVTPSGKVGFVIIEAIAPLGSDQICYVKEPNGAWKIAGFIGGRN